MKIISKEYANLLKEISIAQFKLKDQSTFFGFIWTFLHPMILLVVLFLFFRDRAGKNIEFFPIFLLIGIIQYTHFSNTTSASMNVLYSMRNLVSNTIFPKEILVISSILSSFVEFILEMLICLLIAYSIGVKLSGVIIALPFILLLQFMMVLWVSFILSCSYVFIRDLSHIYQVFLRVLFFITPIFYDISFVGTGSAKYIILLNPLANLISFSRSIIIESKMFSLKAFSCFFLLNLALIYLSFKIFKKYEPKFAEYI